jgi:hypothetical protein
MISEQRQEAIRVLQEICELAPDVRLGQLFAHLGFLGETLRGPKLAYLDDDELLSVLYHHCEELLRRAAAIANAAQKTPALAPTSPG